MRRVKGVKDLAAPSAQNPKYTFGQGLESGLRGVLECAALPTPAPRRLRGRGTQTMADIDTAIADGRD